MILSRSILFAALCAIAPSLVRATTYYVSNSGNDSNAGTSSTAPWKTITKVNTLSSTLLPGDQVLFQRGGTFRGTININCSGSSSQFITLGAYGTGAAPIISGSSLVTSWTAYSGNIYRAQVGQLVTQVFVGGTRQTLARYPNTGWLRNDNASTTSLYDNALTQSANHWTGATVVIRSANWCYEIPVVSGFSGGTLSFPAITTNMGTLNWGYFLCNKLSELDQAGEWFYESTSGYLYLWAPGNADPNTLTVEASTVDHGIVTGWQRQYIKVQDLEFRHQRVAGFRNDGSNFVTVTGCTFKNLYHGVRSYGNNNTYTASTYQDTYATGAYLIDNNTTFSYNTLTNIAVIPGLGETNWGYFGVRGNGSGCVIRGNSFDYTGYTAIEVNQNHLVEKNFVRHALALLNDGGGIAFDSTDGLIVRDNTVADLIGNIDSSAPNFINCVPIGHGIYFGNTSNKNDLIQYNTVLNCPSAGIHYDHTMVSSGNQIKDNVLYNNQWQLSLSDVSNSVGTGAASPFFVAAYNDVISGNLMYCLKEGQMCLHEYNCYSATPVDFGTFSNNKYYQPYDELSIHIHNTFAGTHTYYHLEAWQAERGEDAASTRSPQHLNAYGVSGVLQTNMVVNGTFNSNVTGWGGWPSNATATWQASGFLDGGSLKANLPNNSVYPTYSLRNPNQFAMTSGQWYRMKFSIVSDVIGQVRAGVKGATQFSGASVIYDRLFPFDATRRDMEFLFQGNLTDNSVVQFINDYTDPRYYLDNVSVERVSVQAIDPNTVHTILYNTTANAMNMSLPAGCWQEVGGSITSGTVSVAAYRSKVYYKVDGSLCSAPPPTYSVGAKVFLGGAMTWSTATMRDDLRAAGLVPAAEPYTALGYTLENTGATVSTAVQTATGNQAMVDWVLLELRNNDASYSVAGRRAAIVRRDGTVVATDGSSQVPFNVATQGRYLVVRHRNHLGAMTASVLSSNALTVDLTLSTTATYGTNAQYTDPVTLVKALWPGNPLADNAIRYTGSNNDRDMILTAIGGQVPTNAITGYRTEDINMDAWVIYTGAGNDRDFILQATGGTVPTATRAEQLP